MTTWLTPGATLAKSHLLPLQACSERHKTQVQQQQQKRLAACLTDDWMKHLGYKCALSTKRTDPQEQPTTAYLSCNCLQQHRACVYKHYLIEEPSLQFHASSAGSNFRCGVCLDVHLVAARRLNSDLRSARNSSWSSVQRFALSCTTATRSSQQIQPG
jgi:hypothetical protein